MSKIGVGIGEDFPVDEQARPQPEQDSGCCGEDWHRHRDARREAWRRFRHQMHAEWHARRRAMRDGLRRDDMEAVLDAAAIRERHVKHLIIGGLAALGLAALFIHHSRD